MGWDVRSRYLAPMTMNHPLDRGTQLESAPVLAVAAEPGRPLQVSFASQYSVIDGQKSVTARHELVSNSTPY
jgi:hypothetical protein